LRRRPELRQSNGLRTIAVRIAIFALIVGVDCHRRRQENCTHAHDRAAPGNHECHREKKRLSKRYVAHRDSIVAGRQFDLRDLRARANPSPMLS
jgi:hypothetical protein